MTVRNCHVCSRDIDKTSLVRCQVAACPLREDKPTASRRTLFGVIGLGVAVMGGLALMSSVVTAPGTSRSTVVPRFERAQVASWFDGLMRPRGKQDVAESPSAVPVDWGASKRVETFSCNGQLSAARAAICSNWDLATVDYNLALVYRQALASASNPAAVRAAQRRWLAELEQLDATPDVVLAHYRTQLEKLQGESGKTGS
ncbi:MAG: hypothetical protein C0476_09480 [Sphingomonas sp.]|nr:hypothetical protein [Sphingomonas sp.]